MSVVGFDAVSVDYSGREALAGFTEEVASGEWLGVIGPNGAGKSSLLRAAAGLIDYTGSISVGTPLETISGRERAKLVAYVPQEPLIPDDMTALDYVLLGRTPYVGYFGTEGQRDREIVAGVLARLGLEEFSNRYLGALSGGERQRIVLARALAQEAPVLLLDEPTSALDIGHQQSALELIAELRHTEGITVISAMHDLTLAAAYTDRLVMLNNGEVVASGTAAEVLTAKRLGRVYDVRVNVTVDPEDGSVVVVPRRSGP